ncbi:uncharacterized protein LOC134835735 [Culicoides brevitarsis]|uniref:uncharacterized protein LOC134835735 n=1 Tax=Culicoides brevitarsis TaxID=469753 RepID=UPI00307C897F
MESRIKQLDYDFEMMLFRAKSALDEHYHENRIIPVHWMQKLKMQARSFEEARLRNDFLFYLMSALENASLDSPFDQMPPDVPLLEMKELLPIGTRLDVEEDAQEKIQGADLFRKSPDKGAFLLKQPVPKSGIFCYLAIVAKPDQ